MPYCCVPKCRRSRVTHPGLSFYTFPKNEKTKKRWMANIRRANWEPTIHSVVCSWHFPNGPEYPPTRFEWNETKRLNFFSPEKRKSSKKLHEPVQESASHDNLSEVVTCSKCCEKDEEIARLKMKVESLSNELCQAKMQSKFELIKAKDELTTTIKDESSEMDVVGSDDCSIEVSTDCRTSSQRSEPVERSVDEVLRCPICAEVIKDPRFLPCIHIYCFNCIKCLCQNKPNGSKVKCPVCETEFVIPIKGLDDLPKSFFLARLLDINELVGGKRQTCDICRDDEFFTHDKAAVMYCLGCRKYLCAVCHRSHAKFMTSSLHKTIKLEDEIQDSLYIEYPLAMCEKHEDKMIELHCSDCKEVSCMMCYIEQHSNHKCFDINNVSRQLQSDLSHDIHDLSSLFDNHDNKIKQIEDEKAQFEHKIVELQTEIGAQAQRLHLLIDQNKQRLFEELNNLKENRTKQFNTVINDMKQYRKTVERLRDYMSQLQQKGTASEIVREADLLKVRLHSLMNEKTFPSVNTVLNELGYLEVEFQVSDINLIEADNVIGKLSVRTNTLKHVGNENTDRETSTTEMIASSAVSIMQSGDMAGSVTSFEEINETRQASSASTPTQPTLLKVIPRGDKSGNVRSLAVLGDRLFVVRGVVIEVYDTTTFIHLSNLFIDDLGGAVSGLAACDVNDCLYVSECSNRIVYGLNKREWINSGVHKVSLSTYDVVSKWDLDDCNPMGLSVSAAHNVLVCCTSNTIQEFTTNGHRVRTVVVRCGGPYHAVAVSADYLVVSLCDSHRVCVIGIDGQVVKMYGNSRDSKPGQLNWPCGLAVDKHGYVVVADNFNNRIVMLDPSLSDARQFKLCVEGELRHPTSLCLDEKSKRLYIGESDGQQRVLVFDNVCDVAGIFSQ